MPLKFGIIGLGKISPSHIGAIRQAGGCEITATCDIDESKKVDGIKFYNTHEEMLEKEEIDIVSICTPNKLHFSQALDIINKNKHCIIEKPVSIYPADYALLMYKAHQHNVKIFPILQNRFNPIIMHLKKIMDNGDLGKIHFIGITQHWYRPDSYFMDWHGDKKISGGTFLTLGIHFVDMILHLMPDTPHGIKSIVSSKRGLNVEDSLVCSFTIGDTLGSIDFSVMSYNNNFGSRLRIIAEKGNIEIGGSTAQDVVVWNCSLPAPPECTCGENVYNGYSGSLALHPELYLNVRKTLEGKEEQYIAMEEALKAIEFIQGVYQNGRV